MRAGSYAVGRPPARAGRRDGGPAGPDAGRPGGRPLHHRHAEADQPRGAGPHPLLPGREPDPRRRRQRGRQRGGARRPAPRLSASWATTTAAASCSPPSQRRGIDTQGILVRPGYRTPTKVRILGGGKHSIKQQIVRYDIEETLDADRRRARPLRRPARWRAAGQARGGDPLRLRLRRRRAGPAPAAARRRSAETAMLVCDSRYRLGDFARPRRRHPQRGGGRGAPRPHDRRRSGARWRRAAGALRERLGARFLLITRGSRGMSLFEDGGSAPPAGPRHRPGGGRHRRRRHGDRHLRPGARRRGRARSKRRCSPTTPAASW